MNQPTHSTVPEYIVEEQDEMLATVKHRRLTGTISIDQVVVDLVMLHKQATRLERGYGNIANQLVVLVQSLEAI